MDTVTKPIRIDEVSLSGDDLCHIAKPGALHYLCGVPIGNDCRDWCPGTNYVGICNGCGLLCCAQCDFLDNNLPEEP